MVKMLNLAPIESSELEKIRRSGGWFVALGVLSAVLGFAGLVFVGMATLVSVLFVGWGFLITGVAEVVHAVVRRGWSGFWFDLISGVVTALAGLFVVMHPLEGASVLTVLIGVMFLVGGIFRVWAGLVERNPYAGWFVVHGVVSALLGLMILARWPVSSLWVIGTLVSIDLLFNGIRLVSFGLAVKKLPPATAGADSATAPPA